MTQLILASTSPYRRELLSRLGVRFGVADPGDAEEGIEAAGRDPEELAIARAHAKGRAVLAREGASLVLASDQVCACAGAVLDKPGSAQRHREQLAQLEGQAHELLTAVVLLGRDFERTELEVARLHMRALSAAEIERYATAEPALDCAGGYRLEGMGIALFDQIEAADHTAIIGLPLIATARMLREAGIPLP